MPRDNLRLPPALPRGATLGIVATGSPPPPETLERGLATLREMGFRVVPAANLHRRDGHLAGPDAVRASELQWMFLRSDVDAILCARGGSGSIRLLRHLDWDLIADHPKPFLGHSDVTVLHLAMLKRCRMPGFFAPMVVPDFARGLSPECRESLRRLTEVAAPAGELTDPRCQDVVTLVGGTAEGPCVGGTLSLVAATLGTPFEIDTDGCVFFFEDIHESPARIERYLTQLLLAGKLARAAGFLIGHARWEASEEERARFLPVERVYRDLLVPLGKPLVYGWPIGHVASPMPLPIGVRIRLEADPRRLTILDPAVR